MAGLFCFPAATACVVADDYTVERIEPADASKPESTTVPKEVPAAIAKTLERGGLRVTGKDGKTLCEVWLRSELAFATASDDASNVKQAKLPIGALVGVVKTFGRTHDYRDQAIAAGVHGLRYFHQPSDADHLGTSDSRDFLVVTGLAKDVDPAAVADRDKLVELSLVVSTTDHAVVLYVCPAPDAASKEGAPRVFQRPDKDEWALELTLRAPKKEPRAAKPDANAKGVASGAAGASVDAAPESLRFGLVLVGHTPG
jgi:hypothetical protein